MEKIYASVVWLQLNSHFKMVLLFGGDDVCSHKLRHTVTEVHSDDIWLTRDNWLAGHHLNWIVNCFKLRPPPHWAETHCGLQAYSYLHELFILHSSNEINFKRRSLWREGGVFLIERNLGGKRGSTNRCFYSIIHYLYLLSTLYLHRDKSGSQSEEADQKALLCVSKWYHYRR